MSGQPVPSQLDQVLPRFYVQKAGPYHPFGRIRIAPFGKGGLRILAEFGVYHFSARRHGDLEWQHIVDDLDELSEIEVEQDGRCALLRTAPGATIDPLCRALGITLPPVFQEIPPAPKPARSCGA